MPPAIFRVQILRFRLKVEDRAIVFDTPAANIIRGALGFSLRAVDLGAYQACYEPAPAGPSGLSNPPRPFVLRSRAMDDRVFASGETFDFTLHVFSLGASLVQALQAAIEHMAEVGFGPARSRCRLLSLASEQLELSLQPQATAVRKLEVLFHTPTELKEGGTLATNPQFATLFRRVSERLDLLGRLYQDSLLQIGDGELGLRAERILTVSTDLQHVALFRQSSRTGQRHPLGGFAGSVVYSGDLTEFLPFLRAAQWTGVGRQTVWGKGEIEVKLL